MVPTDLQWLWAGFGEKTLESKEYGSDRNFWLLVQNSIDMKSLFSKLNPKEMIEPRRAQRARSQLFMIQSKKTDWIIRTPRRIWPGG